MTDKQKIQLADRLDYLKTYLQVWIIDPIDTIGGMIECVEMAKHIHDTTVLLEKKLAQ